MNPVKTDLTPAQRRAAHKQNEVAARDAKAIRKGRNVADQVQHKLSTMIAASTFGPMFAMRYVEIDGAPALALLARMQNSGEESVVFFAPLREMVSVAASVHIFETVLGSSVLMLAAIVRDMAAAGVEAVSDVAPSAVKEA